MNALHIRPQQPVADPLQSECVLKALKLMLEHQEDHEARSILCSRLDQSSTTRRHHRESTAPAQATHAAPRLVAAASA
jgi:hypothetical protein